MPYGQFGESSLYLKQNLKEILPRALNEVCQIRPSDPIEYLARYLYRAADCDLYFEEKAVFEAQKRMLEIQLKQEERQRQNAMLKYKKQISELRRCLQREGRKETAVEQLATGPLITRPRSQPPRSVSISGKKDKGHERRMLLFGSAGPSDLSSPADVSDVDISTRVSSKMQAGSPRKSSAGPSILRKVSLPLSEIRSVVSVQRDSQSSSWTQDDDLLERSPSTLTSSSRTTGKRLSVSFGEEGEVKEWLTPPPQSPVMDVKQKLKSREGGRKKERAASVTRGRKKKTKYFSSSSDVSGSSDDIPSVSEFIGALERVDKIRDQIRKSGRRKTKVSTADDETASDMTTDDVTADHVATDDVTADHVAADHVAADHVAADVVSAPASGLSLTEVVEEEEEEEEEEGGGGGGEEEEEEGEEEEEEKIRKMSTLTGVVEDEEEKKISVAKKRRKIARKIRDEILEESSLKKLQEKQLETETSPGPVKVVKKKRKVIGASLKAAAIDHETQKLVDGRIQRFQKSSSIKVTRSPSREMSSEGRAEIGEDELESGESEDDLYEIYDTDNQPSPVGEVTGDDDAEHAKRRPVERKRKRKTPSIHEEGIEETLSKSEAESISVLGSDQKRKGKKRTHKRGAKSVEDAEAEQRQKGPSRMYEALDSAAWEPELQMITGKKSKKGKSKARKVTSVTEYGEEVSEDEQEDEKPGLTSKYSSSLIAGKKGKKGKSKLRKVTSFATEDGEDVSEEARTSRSRQQSLSRETSSVTQSPIPRLSVTKVTGKKGKHGTFFRRRSFRSSITDSSMVSDQLSHMLIPDYAEAVETSLGSSEIEQLAESTETPYVFPFTPVECEWFLADSHTLVCRHPVLGDIRSRPQSVTLHTLNIVGWSETSTYTWQAVYDHEMYTVKDPYLDNYKFRHRQKSLFL